MKGRYSESLLTIAIFIITGILAVLLCAVYNE